MIPLKFGLFWSGTELSYLRFLTFVSLRKHHPDAEIELYLSKQSAKDIKWGVEKQDFQREGRLFTDYIPALSKLGVKVVESNLFPTYAPNYQSDLFRWWWLYNNGGYYLDTDQIILRPFYSLPDVDFIYSIYRAQSCGIYAPVGVIGAKKYCPVVKQIMNEMMDCYDPKDYNSLGPFMFRDLFSKHREEWESENVLFNAPPNYFYPIPESYLINKVYEDVIHITQESYALHWYGGHPQSQRFNEFYDCNSCKAGRNTIDILTLPLQRYWSSL